MLLSDIVEEILEMVGDGPGRYLSPRSIVRKIDRKQKEIYRQYGNNDDDIAVLDILEGVAEYPLPCPAGNITSVYVDNQRLPLRQRNDYTLANYYYLLDQTIGLYMFGNDAPTETIAQGLKIFHKHIPETLSLNAIDAEPDLEEAYRMLLVYGVLIDIAEPGRMGEFKLKYDQLLADYITATRDPETTSISEVFGL